jgi:hypothetical protein
LRYEYDDVVADHFNVYHPLTMPLTMYWRSRFDKMPRSHVFLFLSKLHESEVPSIASVVRALPTDFDLDEYKKTSSRC